MLWRALHRQMVTKMFLAIGLVVGAALLVQSSAESRHEARNLRQETRQSAQTLASMICNAVAHEMLDGQGLKVKALVESLTRQVDAEVHIYDQRGLEVFAPKPPPPAQLPGNYERATRELFRTEEGELWWPLRNEESCQRCHDMKKELRGVMMARFDQEGCASEGFESLAQLIDDGFMHVMTADKSELLDDYFEQLAADSAVIEGVAVYGQAGVRAEREPLSHFGEEIVGLTGEDLREAASLPEDTTIRNKGEHWLYMRPLVMSRRCLACHEDDSGLGEVRGVLAVDLLAAAEEQCPADDIRSVVDSSLRIIMLSNLGRRIADFLDRAATTVAIDGLTLYDDVGRAYWTTDHSAPPTHVAKALDTGERSFVFLGSKAKERARVVEPLANAPGCVQCHGMDDKLRGVVTVAMSTKSAYQAQQSSMKRRSLYTLATVGAILLVLVALMHYLVVRPVRELERVAQAIGGGDLSRQVGRASERGDELARLGQRFNEMVDGLRAKMHLEKFVSKGTAEAAHRAGLDEVAREGERLETTVLFSDIRGFTSYSEKVAPEEVVQMLNRLLRAQADVVHDYEGDIDKFVGDELMALFHGEGAEERAVRCAVDMLDAVDEARRSDLGIGVGISTGPVVYGAIGHEERMDFTVIGDVVNTGARLCSAAAGGTVLVSQAVRDACSNVDELQFEKLEPMSVKGKEAALVVYAATKRGDGGRI